MELEEGESATASMATLCVRCKNKSSVVSLQSSAYCATCASVLLTNRARPVLDIARGAAMAVAVGVDPSARWKEAPKVAAKVSTEGRDPPPVAIAFSGGISSRCLLRVALELFSQRAIGDDERSNVRDPTVGRLIVMYVDDSAMMVGGEDRTEAARAIVEEETRICTQKVQSRLQVTFVPLRLQDLYVHINSGLSLASDCASAHSGPRILAPTSTQRCSPSEALSSLVASISSLAPRTVTPTPASLTRQTSLHDILVSRLLRNAAREHGAVALLLGDTATHSAMRLFEALANGEGYKWPVEGAEQFWINDLFIARPLLSVPAKLAAFYVHHHSLQTLPLLDLTASHLTFNKPKQTAGEKASISRLTESFILSLEHGVPSTVSTITRTAGKLIFTGPSSVRKLHSADAPRHVAASSRSQAGNAPHRLGSRTEQLVHAALAVPAWDGVCACPLCGMPAEAGASSWKAQRSITSRSDLPAPAAAALQGVTNETAISSADTATPILSTALKPGQINLTELLCYSCILVLETPEQPSAGATKELPETMPLPPFIYDAAQSRTARDASVAQEQRGESFEGPRSCIAGVREEAGEEGASSDEPEAEATQDNSQHHMRRKVGTEEMRQRLAGFLLDDDGDEGSDGKGRPRLQRGGTKGSHRAGVSGVDW